MPLAYDTELQTTMAPMAEYFASRAKLQIGDVENRKRAAEESYANMAASQPAVPNVTRTNHTFQANDGANLVIAEFRSNRTTRPSKAIYYIHGGGFILGSIETFEHSQKLRAESSGLPVFSVGYRLAPGNKDLVGDCFAGLKWLYAHADKLGVDSSKILILGESAGGGLAAGTTLMARDNNLVPPLLKQILIYPMLDDRNNIALPEIEDLATWKINDNITAWGALLGDAAGSADHTAVSEYSAPARAANLSGLPPTYMECGQLDIFIHENMKYASRLAEAGVAVEAHFYPGQPHGFQLFSPGTYYSKMAIANVVEAIARA